MATGALPGFSKEQQAIVQDALKGFPPPRTLEPDEQDADDQAAAAAAAGAGASAAGGAGAAAAAAASSIGGVASPLAGSS